MNIFASKDLIKLPFYNLQCVQSQGKTSHEKECLLSGIPGIVILVFLVQFVSARSLSMLIKLLFANLIISYMLWIYFTTFNIKCVYKIGPFAMYSCVLLSTSMYQFCKCFMIYFSKCSFKEPANLANTSSYCIVSSILQKYAPMGISTGSNIPCNTCTNWIKSSKSVYCSFIQSG